MRRTLLLLAMVLVAAWPMSAQSQPVLHMYSALDTAESQLYIPEFEKDTGIKVQWVRLSSGEVLLMHLGMSGSFRVARAGDHHTPGGFHHERAKGAAHDHIVFHMSNGGVATFNDPRRFCCMKLVAREALEQEPLLRALGPEPLGNAFDGALESELSLPDEYVMPVSRNGRYAVLGLSGWANRRWATADLTGGDLGSEALGALLVLADWMMTPLPRKPSRVIVPDVRGGSLPDHLGRADAEPASLCPVLPIGGEGCPARRCRRPARSPAGCCHAPTASATKTRPASPRSGPAARTWTPSLATSGTSPR